MLTGLLVSQARTPIVAAMDLGLVREALRREREARVGSRARLEELTGQAGGEPIDQSTIYRIETDETYIPGIDTVLRLIEAMPNLTPALFFSNLNFTQKDRIDLLRSSGSNLGPPDPLPRTTTEALERILDGLLTISVELSNTATAARRAISRSTAGSHADEPSRD